VQLYIGNKNYSSWSMRPWVLMTQAGIAFEEVVVRFDSFEPGSAFKTRMAALSPTAQVPVLVDDGWAVWDTLAIAEYLAERHPQHALWPRAPRDRACARSVCAQMHAGFGALRQAFPMNIEASLAQVGARVLAQDAAVRRDLALICRLWEELLARHGGPMLFGDFGIVDAYYAPVVMRLWTYRVPVPPPVAAYVERVQSLAAVAAWCGAARAEHDFLAFEEPYRGAPQAPPR
jgi:glutathione S-transferase